MSEKLQVDLTPDPRVLRALTHTPLRPIDALCELIDNSLDSFTVARRLGRPIPGAMVLLTIPSKADLAGGGGVVAIRDNGPGLTIEDAEKALRAGFSGNNPFDTLGLFGMGFNIASGKLGTRTRFLTVNRDGPTDAAVQIVVDLPAMEKAGHYNVPVERVQAPNNFGHGTQIEVSGWWPAGNPNRDFIQKLAAISKPKLREEIGRRYSSILLKNEVRIIINGDTCVPFEHCVWSSARSVERQVWGRIPARYDFDEMVGTQTRCARCFTQIESSADCANCGPGATKRTIEERVRGWLGIQRYDDPDHFGVDLIRNGRAIRVLEKEAFFIYTDELGRKVTDYPIDGPYGRIVGEVHLDHVPVDFMKQDFQRSSREWDSAIRYLRGESSLQPRQSGTESNLSPLFKLYQGYRRVRNIGKKDLYPGRWDTEQRCGVRLSREAERELLQKFRDRVPGFYDDSEWWKAVEAADQAPVQGIKTCSCGMQVLEREELCPQCGTILLAKACIQCATSIPASAQSCPACGISQVPEILEPWVCAVCSARNTADAHSCVRCSANVGEADPLSEPVLVESSEQVDELTIPGLSFKLVDDSLSAPFDLKVRRTKNPLLVRKTVAIPSYSVSSAQSLTVFIDYAHEAFSAHGMDVTTLVAYEAARRIHDERMALVAQGRGLHTVPRLASLVLKKLGALTSSVDLSERIRSFFVEIGEALNAANPQLVESVVSEMDEVTERQVVAAVQASGRSLAQYPSLVADGTLVSFMPPSFLVHLFRQYPEKFFDGRVFSDQYTNLASLSESTAASVQAEAVRTFALCLEDCVQFLTLQRNSRALQQRARYSLDFLVRSMA